MIDGQELVDALDRLDADALQRWINFGWVHPLIDGDDVRFDTSDVARVRLICDLHYELLIEESSVSVVLSLLDQLYAVRRDWRALAAAVEAQPYGVREAIAKLAQRDAGSGR
jgi:chaperone modulatory protein CbpM